MKSKDNCGAILTLAILTFLFILTVPCWAAEKKDDIWDEDKPQRPGQELVLTEKAIERMMDRLAEADPKRAQGLARLRKEKPKEFEVELRKAMREHLGRKMREHVQKGRRKGPPGEDVRGRMRKRDPLEIWGGSLRKQLEHEEYIKWLEKNYPSCASELDKIREKNPQLYRRKLALSLEKYGRIFKVSKENPALAEVLKQDLQLKDSRNELLKKISAANDGEKQALVGELEQILSSRFDLIVKRKELEYDRLSKKLQQLEEKVNASRTKIEKWKEADFKTESVKARLKTLVSETEQFKWD
ncbi:MAG: hypothetical protein JXB29_13080 [Sedimentisphaerales bacterium]|nr:hypothetical protein [Sedimentisphaerales bacterium]